MRNQPFHQLSSSSADDGRQWIDQLSRRRLLVMLGSLAVIVGVVVGRIGWVQANLQARYLQVLNLTSTEYESIPARDGRILIDPGHVLAADRDQFTVQVHYRWLQQDFDSAWLQRRLRKRLSAAERRQPELVEIETRRLEQSRDQMWARLSETASIPPDELKERRAQIEQRVQRIAESVNERWQQTSESHELLHDENPLMRAASALRSALTSTPQRVQERIVVREEESWHNVAESVLFDAAAVIRERPQDFPGVRVVAEHQRTYPLASLAAHIVGARVPKASSADVLDETATSTAGKFGVEFSFDHQLKGTAGRRRIVRNRRQEIIESVVERQPVNGRDIVLTLNLSVQQHVERLLREALLEENFASEPDGASSEANDVIEPENGEPADTVPRAIPAGGCIVAMDVNTGRILAAASAPSFDLTLFTHGSQQQWDAINKDRRRPMFNRLTSMAIPPGSVVKPLTAVAALENGVLKPDTAFHCQGFLETPDRHRCLIYRLYGSGHGDLTLRRALAQSCNVYFFDAADRLESNRLRHWFEAFGFGRNTGVDLPWEKPGHLPPRTPEEASPRRRRSEILGLAIGQARLTTTPLQIARAMAAIANGGWLVTPHVVSPDGSSRSISETDDRPRRLSRHRIPGLQSESLDAVKEGLTAVVQQPFGTGYETVQLKGLTIAGKTGTAETGSGKADHAWFAGYAPADEPQVAVVVVLEHGGSGSRAAGPIAREVFRALLAEKLVRSPGG